MNKWGKLALFISGLAIVLLFVFRFILGGWVDYLWIPLGIAIGAFIAALALDFSLYIDFFTMRTTKHGMNMGALIMIAFGLIVAVNYLSVRFNKTWDVTEERLNSLSDQSMRVLSDLKDDVVFTVLYGGADDTEERANAKVTLSIYTASSKRIRVRFVNFYENIQEAKKYFKEGDKAHFMVVAEQGDRRSTIDDNFSESSITAGIMKVSRKEQRTIYFTTGHGEADIDTEGASGLQAVRTGLEEMSFKVAKLSLATGDKLPTGDGVVAIVGPRTPFLETELDALRAFIRQGGRLLIAVDPGMRHGLANLTKSFGIEFLNNYILTEQLKQVGIATIGAQYDRVSDITRRFSVGFFTLFFDASELAHAPGVPSDWLYRDLVQTEAQSLTTNDPGKGIVSGQGKPRVVGIEVEMPIEAGHVTDTNDKKVIPEKPKSKVIVFGDSDFLTGKAIHQMGNRDLALNIFADMGREPELVGIRPKQPKGSSLIMTRNSQVAILVTGIGLPFILLFMGGFFWFRRRNL